MKLSGGEKKGRSKELTKARGSGKDKKGKERVGHREGSK